MYPILMLILSNQLRIVAAMTENKRSARMWEIASNIILVLSCVGSIVDLL